MGFYHIISVRWSAKKRVVAGKKKKDRLDRVHHKPMLRPSDKKKRKEKNTRAGKDPQDRISADTLAVAGDPND